MLKKIAIWTAIILCGGYALIELLRYVFITWLIGLEW